MSHPVFIYDTTLRDGAQGAGLSFSAQDKLRVAELLDELGVHYIEAGAPGSNPKDAEFFKRVAGLKNAELVAFGPTCRAGIPAAEDAGLAAILAANTKTVCVFGKAWSFHATEILGVTRDENLEMIRATVEFLKSARRQVFFDAEHFFDGYKNDREYALAAVLAAEKAGADLICLCDTNGGSFSHEISDIFSETRKILKVPMGIHAHSDIGMEEANAVSAVLAGATQVQSTIGGYGERCGNTDTLTVSANLTLKLGFETLPRESFGKFAPLSRRFYELCNLDANAAAPYVGSYAFSHKGGMHIDAVRKNSISFEHVSPAAVGAQRKFLVSEFSGRAAILERARAVEPALEKDSPEIEKIVAEIKRLENEGYQFEGADASFALVVKRTCGTYRPHFGLKSFHVTVSEPAADEEAASAVCRIEVGGYQETSGAVGNGPVNALDRAMRLALERFYPQIADVKLEDYRVRVLGSNDATASKVRVVIESSDGRESWSTVGVSADIVGASWTALVDAMEYKLMRDGAQFV